MENRTWSEKELEMIGRLKELIFELDHAENIGGADEETLKGIRDKIDDTYQEILEYGKSLQ